LVYPDFLRWGEKRRCFWCGLILKGGAAVSIFTNGISFSWSALMPDDWIKSYLICCKISSGGLMIAVPPGDLLLLRRLTWRFRSASAFFSISSMLVSWHVSDWSKPCGWSRRLLFDLLRIMRASPTTYCSVYSTLTILFEVLECARLCWPLCERWRLLPVLVLLLLRCTGLSFFLIKFASESSVSWLWFFPSPPLSSLVVLRRVLLLFRLHFQNKYTNSRFQFIFVSFFFKIPAVFSSQAMFVLRGRLASPISIVFVAIDAFRWRSWTLLHSIQVRWLQKITCK
jgi:hypothetical protein